MRLEELDKNLADRIIRNRVIDPITNCWNWTGSVTHNNHAQLSYNGRNQAVARWIMGIRPGRKINVNHKDICQNPRCFNPEHLYIGTQSDNIRDLVRLGKYVSNLGEFSRLKTHCTRGHEYNDSIRNVRGDRICKICMKAANRRSKQRKEAKLLCA